MTTVNKPWGCELWIESGDNTPYAFKEILFRGGHRTSLQVHQYKCETLYVLSGGGELRLSRYRLDIEAFNWGELDPQSILEYEGEMAVYQLEPGFKITIQPGYVHRVIAHTDLKFIEVSTLHLDDVYRLQDDSGRTHGRIPGEHA